jgi:hypothetical protein
MESKNCNKNKDEEEEEEEEEENVNEYIQKIQEHKFNVIWETRLSMIRYCDDVAIPLCDYLTMEILEKFIDNLTT